MPIHYAVVSATAPLTALCGATGSYHWSSAAAAVTCAECRRTLRERLSRGPPAPLDPPGAAR